MGRKPHRPFRSGRDSEPGLNRDLAAALRDRLRPWTCEAERTQVVKGGSGKRPDIVVMDPGGRPVLIETELMPASTVENDACGRLGDTLENGGARVEQVIALRYPAGVAQGDQAGALERILEAELSFCVLSGKSADDRTRWPNSGWVDGGVDDLAACIECLAVSEDLITQGMETLEEGVDHAAARLRGSARAERALREIAEALHQEDGEQTSRMAMAILANAMTFHTAIEGSHDIRSLGDLRGARGRMLKGAVEKEWQRILDDINYWPIFQIALKILRPINTADGAWILNRLADVADELAGLGATSRQDLGGRMFQRLIADRKFLATFYTLPNSAVLLAELAMARLDVDWGDADAVAGLRIADFACGTGALLGAAYGGALRRHRWAGGDGEAIHPRMMESALVGADIMPAATHLTAAMLSSAHPGVTFNDTSIVTLPYGEREVVGMRGWRNRGSRGDDGDPRAIAIGALDLIENETAHPLFATGEVRQRGSRAGQTELVMVKNGSFDLVIMNPPFTRSTGQEAEKVGVPVPSFAGFATSEIEQREMSARLSKIRRRPKAGHGNAGLASNFIDLADAKVRDGGTVALVLPSPFLQGKSWANARALLEAHYRDVVVVSIASAGSTERAFSADTGMGEVLVLATRRYDGGVGREDVLFVNLTERPASILDAAMTAREIAAIPADSDAGRLPLETGKGAGRYIRGGWTEAGGGGVKETGVGAAARTLAGGHLDLPRWKRAEPIPVVALGELGKRGRYHMDLSGRSPGKDKKTGEAKPPRGPFDIEGIGPGDIPAYPALWNHDAHREKRLFVGPDSQGIVRDGCKERAAEQWKRTASRLHFNRDFRLNSQPLAACMTPELSIGGTAWPNFLCHDLRWERALALWANTTLGLVAFWWIGDRQQQGRARLSISKLPELTVLDTRTLTAEQLDIADSVFDDFAGRELLPANEAWHDETRKDLDRAVLIDLLGLRPAEGVAEILEPLDLLRRQWCMEPSVHGGKPTRPE